MESMRVTEKFPATSLVATSALRIEEMSAHETAMRHQERTDCTNSDPFPYMTVVLAAATRYWHAHEIISTPYLIQRKCWTSIRQRMIRMTN